VNDVLADRERRNFLWRVTDADGEKAAIEVARAGQKGGNLIAGWRPADTVDTGQWRLV
jgi:hypothetical protein